MKELLTFLGGIAPEIHDLYEYVRGSARSPDAELQLAMRIIRKASDEQARREIEG